MQREGWRWATFWSVEWGCLKASGAEKPGAVKSSILWQRWGRGHLPLPGLRQRRAEMCTTNRRDAMVTWAGTCLGLDVIFLPSISNILGGLLRAGKGLTVLEAHFTLLFIPSLWHRCFAILFVNGSCVLNLPRHLVLLQLVPLTPSALCTVTSPCPGTANAHFSQFHLTLLSNHPDKPVSLSAYNHWILCSLDHTCLSVVQKDYVCLEISTYFNKWMIAELYNLFMFGLCTTGLDFGYSIVLH